MKKKNLFIHTNFEDSDIPELDDSGTQDKIHISDQSPIQLNFDNNNLISTPTGIMRCKSENSLVKPDTAHRQNQNVNDDVIPKNNILNNKNKFKHKATKKGISDAINVIDQLVVSNKKDSKDKEKVRSGNSLISDVSNFISKNDNR